VKLLLDTHALLWWQAKSKKLSRRAAKEIGRADVLLVSSISCWEIATLLAERRIQLDRTIDAWLEDMASDETIELVPLTPRAAVQAYALDAAGFRGDPADRLIYATAAELMVPLVTADTRIHEFVEDARLPVRLVW
jgi:PIN domain nuclease of toxin-antitoxin system